MRVFRFVSNRYHRLCHPKILIRRFFYQRKFKYVIYSCVFYGGYFHKELRLPAVDKMLCYFVLLVINQSFIRIKVQACDIEANKLQTLDDSKEAHVSH